MPIVVVGGKNGTIENAVTVPGVIGNALYFDSTGDWVEIANWSMAGLKNNDYDFLDTPGFFNSPTVSYVVPTLSCAQPARLKGLIFAEINKPLGAVNITIVTGNKVLGNITAALI